jgi:hypothetical protein
MWNELAQGDVLRFKKPRLNVQALKRSHLETSEKLLDRDETGGLESDTERLADETCHDKIDLSVRSEGD